MSKFGTRYPTPAHSFYPICMMYTWYVSHVNRRFVSFSVSFSCSASGFDSVPFPEDRLLQDRVAADLCAAPAVPPLPASRERRHTFSGSRGGPGGQRRSAPLPVLLLPGACEDRHQPRLSMSLPFSGLRMICTCFPLASYLWVRFLSFSFRLSVPSPPPLPRDGQKLRPRFGYDRRFSTVFM